MTHQEAIELLRAWQRQIIDGPKTFSEIADVMEKAAVDRAALRTALMTCPLLRDDGRTTQMVLDWNKTTRAVLALVEEAER